MQTGEPQLEVEEEQVLRDGTTRWMSSSKVPMRDHQGKIIGLMGISRDITALKNKEQELEKLNLELQEALDQARSADRVKNEFLSVMSHELRTPLNGILGYAEMMMAEKQLSAHELHDKLRIIQSSGESLLRILGDILDFTQLEGGHLKLEESPFSLAELAWKAVRMIEPAAVEKSLQLFVEIGDRVPKTVSGDPERIQQILLNLLRNAVKFTEHGRITLQVDLAESGKILFSVEDSGIGIPADQLKNIFLPFTQVDSSIGRQFGGIGMGLTISRRLLQSMGSDIKVTSQPGKGSLFSFEIQLPRSSSDSVPSQSQAAACGEMDKGFAIRFPGKILVVEDNPVNARLLVNVLEKLGYRTVLTAGNGSEALSLFEQEQVDLIFMDLQMPVMDGMEAVQKIRAREAQKAGLLPVRIIAVTANTSASIRRSCLALGMNYYISKPFNSRSIAEAIVLSQSA